ncbi:MAG: DUF748 domain-containing protein [Paludibacteraceae bacterium]|nr:DUF748 domain-containing protein [Paludibacteraceae bacterium]
MKKILKICGWGALVIVLLFALILVCVSPAAKYVVNNYGEEIIGRQLHADQVIINPYWGGVTIRGFECKEQNGETNFISFDHLYVQIAYPRLIGKNVKIRAIHLDGFNGQVLKSKDKLNFSDIIERYTKNDTIPEEPKDTTKSGWTVALDDIRLNNSTVRYRDVITHKQWSLEDITLRVPGLYFDNTQTNAGIEFALPTGGRVGIIAGYRMRSNNYAVRLNLYDVHTDVVLPLVQDYLNISGLGAKLNGSVLVEGSLDAITNVQLKGNLAMAGLSIRDKHNDQVAALDELRVAINKGDLNTNTFLLDTLSIFGITGDYEVHETWNTMTRLMKKDEDRETSAIEALNDSAEAKPKKQEPKESKPLVWMAKRVHITGHDITYSDYSMKHDWQYAIQTFELTGSNVATNGRNSLNLNATLTNNAKLKADFVGGLDLASQDTRINVKLTGVNLHDFNALCRNYTGYPLEGGDLRLDSHIDVVCGKMKGNNQIVIDHPRVGKKEKFSKAKYKNIPVRTGVKMLTSAQDMIVLDVPVAGDARNPKFKLGKVIGRALLKVFFGPLMGVNDRKTVSAEEIQEMQELLGEDSVSLGNDATGDVSADVAMTAGDSVGLSEVSK